MKIVNLLLALTLLIWLPLRTQAAVLPDHPEEKGPHIQMDVVCPGNNSGSFDIGQPQTWIIRGDVPADIGSAREYVITDILDSRLSCIPESTVVKLADRTGEEATLEPGLHYTLPEKEAEDVLRISLTLEGMTFVAENQGKGGVRPELRVYFDSCINTNAGMGSTIPNAAQLTYVTSEGIFFQERSDIPEVHTGGLNLQITDPNAHPVDGAVFLIAREATQADLEQGALPKDILKVKEKNLAVVFPTFFTTKDLSGDPSNCVSTGPDGKAALYGLSYGTYYLIEIQTPDGDLRKSEPMTVHINETSHLTEKDGWMDTEGNVVDKTVQIRNAGMLLPDTGGSGTMIFPLTGSVFLLAACILILRRNRTHMMNSYCKTERNCYNKL